MEPNKENIQKMSNDEEIKSLQRNWHLITQKYFYAYNFQWMGISIIQTPQDIVAWQELVMCVQPDLIIETGIAHGGSLFLSASLLALLEIQNNECGFRKVIGVDIDIRKHTSDAIKNSALQKWMITYQSSSIDPSVINKIKEISKIHHTIMVFLDSNHTKEHVLAELEMYAPLVTPGSYIVVNDTGMEQFYSQNPEGRPWGPGNGPLTAVKEFLTTHPEFEQDFDIENKLVITSNPGGWLRRKP